MLIKSYFNSLIFLSLGRWGLLLKGCDLAMDFTKVVQVCCVLHNLCEGAGDMFFEHWYNLIFLLISSHIAVNK